MAGDEELTGRDMAQQGTFYGIGVGPGDPELLTLKAVRIIAAASVVAYPVNGDGESLARSIAAGAMGDGARELPVHIPMCTERDPASDVYDTAALAIAGHLDAGEDVAFLCEGDPFFYGSFMYLFARVAERHPTVVVPGITSLTACAAALGRPLAARNERLKVLPAPLPEETLKEELSRAEAAAIIKVGRHFDKVRRVLNGLGLSGRAAIVEQATRGAEKVTPLDAMPEGEQPYFSTILVYCGDEPW
ncbi:MAG: precorrin-2 C(20)-methyltransferase [Hyphomicrobiales bacterium]